MSREIIDVIKTLTDDEIKQEYYTTLDEAIEDFMKENSNLLCDYTNLSEYNKKIKYFMVLNTIIEYIKGCEWDEN